MSNSKSLITLQKPNSVIAESYKMFRTNLSYMNVDEDTKVILFTSSSSEEGKTTTVSNLAIEMAKAGNKTLLIECDLRKARVHEIFEVPQSPGLTNLIVNEAFLEDVVWKKDSIPGLDIVTAGPLPPSPAELLSSKRIEKIVEEARGVYDKILIDAPPVLMVTDAAILSRFSDGVILVAASGETSKDALVHAKKQLDNVDADVLGVVLTKIDMKKSGYYYSYKGYYGNSDERKGWKRIFGKRKRKRMDYLKED